MVNGVGDQKAALYEANPGLPTALKEWWLRNNEGPNSTERNPLRAIGRESFGQPSRQAHHGRGAVGRIEKDIDDIGLAEVG